MKKLTLTFLMLILSASIASAHCGVCGVGEAKGSDKGSAKGSMKTDMKEKMNKMYEGLNLTDDQKAKIAVLKETKHKAIQAAKDEFKAGLKEILTEEQLAAFEMMHSNHQH